MKPIELAPFKGYLSSTQSTTVQTVSIVNTEKVTRKQKIILDKVNIDRLYTRLSNILFDCTFPGNLI